MRLCSQMNISSCLDFNLTSSFLLLIVDVELRISRFFSSYFFHSGEFTDNPKTVVLMVCLTQVHSSLYIVVYRDSSLSVTNLDILATC